MGKHGINVPKGVAVGSVEEVRKAIREVFPNQSEVVLCNISWVFDPLDVQCLKVTDL